MAKGQLLGIPNWIKTKIDALTSRVTKNESDIVEINNNLGHYQFTNMAKGFYGYAPNLAGNTSIDVIVDISAVSQKEGETILPIIRQTRNCIAYVKDSTDTTLTLTITNPSSTTQNCYAYLLILWYKYV